MDLALPALGAAPPRHTADLRPSADAAALARETAPQVPLGTAPALPASPAQIAAVTQAVLNGTTVRPPAPVLRPFGIEMIPGLPRDLPHRLKSDGS